MEHFSLPDLRALLVSTCNIWEQAQTKSAMGFASSSRMLIAPNLPCRVEKLKPDVAAMLYPKFDQTKVYRVYFAGEDLIDEYGSTLSLGVRNDMEVGAEFYQVQSVINVDNLGLLFEIDCLRKPT